MHEDPLIGHQLANFKIERVIGRGGMAQVYYGQDIKLQRPVALKVIDARYRGNQSYAQRFVREAQMAATWRHDNILQVYYADEQDGLYYFAMEYVDGQDLGNILASYANQNQRMPQAEVLRITQAIASALDYIHSKGVIHRDVKPSNVMVASDGRVVLADFGLALDVEQGSIGETFGSAHYIAPEQARHSSQAVPQSDLYALGVIIYQMLTGQLPFDDPSPLSVSIQHLSQPPPAPRSLNPALSPEIEAVVLKVLSKAPGERYQSGRELAGALEQAMRGAAPTQAELTPPSSPTSIARRAGQPRRRRPAWLAVVGLVCGLALVAGLGTAMSGKWMAFFSKGQPSTQPASTPALGARPVISPLDIPIGPYRQHLPFAAKNDPAAPNGSISAPLSPLATPTRTYSDGQRVLIFYNEGGVYIFNASDQDIQISPLAFERLGASEAGSNRFDGWRWSRYHALLRVSGCLRAEIRTSALQRPPQCLSYNSQISASDTDSFIFWTAQAGSAYFRVLWDEQEVARCEIAAEQCEVFLP